jgi:hypothetical protein
MWGFGSEQPVLFGKIVPGGFRLSNLFLRFGNLEAYFHKSEVA